MKDKLTKFGHKTPYYVMRKTLYSFLALICLGSAFAVPTYIATHSKVEGTVKALDENDSSSSDELLSYECE